MTTRSRLFVVSGLALLLVSGALILYSLNTSPAEAIEWTLDAGVYADSVHKFDQSKTATMTDFYARIHVWPPAIPPADDSWVNVSVGYAADHITVTLHPDDAHSLHKNGLPTVGWYDTGGWVHIHLSEPLAGRNIMDGGTGKYVILNLPL